MAMDELEFGEDFGQKIDLTVRIREILRNYPEGTSVLKEMVQNADDAGATEISFCLDMRTHSSNQLAYTKLATFQGPSLMVHNNARFTDADFESIQRIGDSLKKDNSQGWKTGRFGIGFNSVYHITDLPTFVSGSHIVMFDPHASYLPNVNPSNPGKMINFMTRRDLLEQFPDQFCPFEGFGCDLKKPFDGTTFRLPLRTPDHAKESKLTSRPQTVDSIKQLLQDLVQESTMILLFLRNVTSISVLHWYDGQSEPTLLNTTAIKNLSPDLQHNRSQAKLKTLGFTMEGYTCDYLLEIEVKDNQSDANSITKWIICNQLGGGDSTAMAINPENASLRLVPYGGIAANLDTENPVQGRAFCFLPLPVETNLPVHVNGYFELSSNRRDIWAGDGLTGEGLLRAQWNLSLLQSVIAPCYARAIVAMTRYHTTPHLFPLQLPVAPWKALILSMLRYVACQPCLYTLKETFVAPKDALVLDVNQKDKDVLEKLLVADGIELVRLTPPLQALFLSAGTIRAIFTAANARQWYRRRLTVHGSDTSSMFALLTFALSDAKYDDLVDVQLLPLMDKSVGRIQMKARVDPTGLQQLLGMKFPRSMCIKALQKFQNDAQAALDWLLTSPQPTLVPNLFYICTPLELRLFESSCKSSLIDMTAVGALSSVLQSLTNRYNIQQMSVSDLRDFLPVALPASWSGQTRVNWSSESSELPTFQWFQDLWTYIGTSPNALEDLEESWPIVPTQSGIVCTLRRHSSILHTAWLAPSLIEILLRMKVDVLAHDLFLGDVASEVWTYFQQPTPEGVIATLSSARVESLNANDRDELRNYLLSLNCEDMSIQTIQALRTLPLFHGLTSNKSEKEHDVLWSEESSHIFTPLTKKLCIAPDIASDLLDDRFIVHPEIPKVVLQRLGIPLVSNVNFFTEYMFKPSVWTELAMPTQLKLLETFLLQVTSFIRDNPQLLGRIHKLRIFISMTGSLQCITELYDPDIEAFVDMIEPSCFPVVALQTPAYLGILRVLGMQQTLTRASLLHIAEVIATTEATEDNINEFRGRAKEFLKYVDAHADRLLQPQVAATFEKRKKTLQTKTSGFFKSLYDKRASELHEDETKVSHEALQVEMQDIINFREQILLLAWMPVQQTPSFGCLPWQANPPLVSSPIAIRPAELQWLCSASFFILDGTIQSPSLKELFGWNEPVSVEVLVEQLGQFQQFFSTNSSPSLDDIALLSANISKLYRPLADYTSRNFATLTFVQQSLANVPWLWIQDRFWRSEHVAFQSYIFAYPYLTTVPKDLLPFETLLTQLDVRRVFSSHDYVAVLDMMHKKYGEKELTKEDLVMTIQLAQALSDEASRASLVQHEIYLPTSSNVLALATSLLFNDAPWLTQPSGLVFVHPQISNVVAEKLGVESLRLSLLASTSEALGGPEKFDGVESFGQSEPLTSRLAHILEQYPEGTSVIHELIQNADDAGATQFSVCLNLANYGSSSLLSASMGIWQGPALYCYNNATFTANDFTNLTKIGQGHKLNRISTTGRFGLGFNSVYHITDLPSIVSGDSLVMFDPHATYVPNATNTHPGIKIKFLNSNVISQFPDQFAPYNLFGCTLHEEYKGTLFRFPFRTGGIKSEIKATEYTDEDMRDFLTQFRTTLASTMIFLRHVQHISVYIKTDALLEPSLLYEASVPERPPNMLEAFTSKFAFYRHLKLHTDISVNHHVLPITLTEPNSNEIKVEKYLVSSALGVGKAKDMALASTQLKLVPYVGIAARLDTIPKGDGRAFCFLPLPVKVGMPVHINGYFELSSNRRDIWHGDDMTGEGRKRSDWNNCLLADVVAPTYLAMLQEAQKHVSKEHYMALFPSVLPPSPWDVVVDHFYAGVNSLNLVWCQTLQQFIPFHSIMAMDPAIAPQLAHDIQEILQRNKISFATFTPKMLTLLLERRVLLGSTTPHTFRHLLHSDRLQLSILPRSLISTVVKLCCDDIQQESQLSQLHSLPLLALRNQTFAPIQLRFHGKNVYFCTPQEQEFLESKCPELVVDMELCGNILKTLPGFVEKANVKYFSLNELASSAKSIFFESWQRRGQILPITFTARTVAWWRSVWTYIDDEMTSGRIDTFPKALMDLPIKPCRFDGSHHCLVPMNTPALASLPAKVNEEMRNNIQGFLKKYDVYELHTMLFPNNVCPPWMEKLEFAYKCDGNGLLDLLALKSLRSIPHSVARNLASIICGTKFNNLTKPNQKFVRTLPLFEAWKNGSETTQVSLDMGTFVLPPHKFKWLQSPMLCLQSFDERTFCKEAGVEELSNEVALMDYVLPHLSNFEPMQQADIIVHEVLCKFDSFSPVVQDKLSTNLRIPTANTKQHELSLISELYDPTSEALQALLSPSSFPLGIFCTSAHLQTLKKLGLKQTLSCQAMLDGACGIAANPDVKKAKYLLEVVNENFDKLYNPETDVEIVSKMSTIAWLPVMMASPLPILPWKQSDSGIASAKETWTKENLWFASATKFILDGFIASNVLLEAFSWTITPEILASQIVAIAQHFEATPNTMTMLLAERCAVVYNKLDECVAELFEDNDDWKEELLSSPWIWTSSQSFVRVSQIAEVCPENLSPILVDTSKVSIPSRLLQEFEIKKAFEEQDYANALELLPSNVPLSDSQMDVCVALVTLLENPTSVSNILLPDTDCILGPSAELVVDDMPWHPRSDETQAGKRYVHSRIPVLIALKFALSRHALVANTSSNSIKMMCPAVGSITSHLPPSDGDNWCGKLLRDILDVAESLKCAHVDVLIDHRHHADQKVQRPSFQALQQEAICFHLHDVQLSPETLFVNYAKGSAGILAGLFISDSIQVLSGDYFFVVDPCGKYLESPSTVWCSIKTPDFHSFSDQLAPFSALPLASGNPYHGFKGTIIRCPFRSADSGTNLGPSLHADSTLLEKFITYVDKFAPTSVLFTSYLQRFTVWNIGLHSAYAKECIADVQIHDAAQVLSLRQNLLNDDEWKKNRGTGFFGGVFKRAPTLPTLLYNCTILVESKNKTSKHEWCVSANLAVGRTQDMAKNNSLMVPHAAVACLVRCDDSLDFLRPNGHLYSTFRSNVMTNLPVHINAGFYVNAPGLDIVIPHASHSTLDTRRKWNLALLEDSVTEAYIQLLNAMKGFSNSTGSYRQLYKAWPTLRTQKGGDKNALGGMIQALVYPKIIAQELFLCSDNSYRKLSDGYFFETQTPMQVKAYVNLQGFPIFNVPPPVMIATKEHATPRMLSPSVLRDRLRYVSPTSIKVDLCYDLLSYCLRELNPANYGELAGLPVLTLADGTVGTIPKPSLFTTQLSEPYIVATFDQQLLLPSMKSRFLSLNFCQEFKHLLSDTRFTHAIGAVQFSVQFLADNVAMELPPSWRNQSVVEWSKDNDSGVSPIWLARFWKEIELKENVSLFHAWPLVPVQNKNQLIRCRYVEDLVVFQPNEASFQLSKDLEDQLNAAQSVSNEQQAEHAHERMIMQTLTEQLNDIDDSEMEPDEMSVECSDAESHEVHEEVSESEDDDVELSFGSEPLSSDESTTHESESNQRLQPLLTRLEVPILELGYFPSNRHSQWIPRQQDMALTVLASLAKWASEGYLQWNRLSRTEREVFIEYFSDHGHVFGGFNRQQLEQIRSLPIFYSLFDEPCILTRGTFYMLDESMTSYPLYLAEHTKQFFIHVKFASLTNFYKELGIQVLSEADMIIKFMIGNIQPSQLPLEQRMALLDTISRRWSVFQRERELVDFLKATALFPARDGLVVPASTLLDPTNPVFQAVLMENSPERFPVVEFSTPQWLDILHDLGAKKDLDPELFKLCAHQVSLWPCPLSSAHEAGALALHEYFSRNFDRFERSRLFLEELSRIAFVPATEHSLHEKSSMVLKRYCDCAVPQDEHVVYFSKPIAISFSVPPRVMWRRLGLISPPPVQDVLANIQALTSDTRVLDEWKHSIPVLDIFQKIFAYCDENWGSLGASVQSTLREMPLLPIGTHFVKASRVYVRLPENFAPFVFEVPRVFGAYDGLFTRLGTKEIPTVNDYALLLLEIAQECPLLNLNELRAVTKIITILADMLTMEALDHPLVLPTTTHQLIPLTHCVVNDAKALHLSQRIDLTMASVFLVHSSLSEAVCRQLNVPNLSSIIQETIAPRFSPVPTVDTSEMTKVLRSKEFASGLERIVQCQSPGSHGELPDFTAYSIVAVESLETRLILRATKEDVTKDSNSLCFIDTQKKILYVTLPGNLTLAHVVAFCIQHTLPDLIVDCSPILAMLQATDIPYTLHCLHIAAQDILEPSRGVPGTPLCEMDLCALELKPLRSFLPSEIVAIALNDSYCYATVVQEQLVGGLKHVELLIDTQHTTKSFPSTQVYAFQSIRTVPSHVQPMVLEKKLETVVEQAAIAPLPRESIAQAASLPVSDSQVLEAVNELLGRLNMSLSAPYEELVQETVRLKSRLQHAEESYHAATQRLEQALEEKRDVLEAMNCSICLENDVNRVLVPCGHTFCQVCINRLPRSKCPICREPFTTSCAFHKPY